MVKRSLSEQLDDALGAIIARADSVPLATADPRLAALLGIATHLRDLPGEDFKARLKDDLKREAMMTNKAKSVPEDYHTATPYLILKDAASAIEFYKQVFGATELARLVQPDGKIGHAEIKIGDSRIMIADEYQEMGIRSPQSLGGSAVIIHLYVEDVDSLASRMIAAGAKVLRPVEDQFYGDRAGKLTDPFGHVWIIATRKEEVSTASREPNDE
jgi:PhnB protein